MVQMVDVVGPVPTDASVAERSHVMHSTEDLDSRHPQDKKDRLLPRDSR